MNLQAFSSLNNDQIETVLSKSVLFSNIFFINRLYLASTE